MSDYLDPEAVSGTSSEAVERATGKPWADWMAILDGAGGRQMNHKQLVAHLVEHYDVAPWWRQQVAVGYEKSRRLRAEHEMPDGYQISRTRTLAAPSDAVFAAWADDAARARWLPDAALTIRKATPPKTLRIVWADGTKVDVELTAKGDRTVVSVQHSKLPDGDTAERMKGYWAEALGRLGAYLAAS